ncbi:MAG: beta-lactamase family protein [Alphaproteobacteria bacterium]|nr:beta-lactamase family protein [Alphaproteobacteria bacterium]
MAKSTAWLEPALQYVQDWIGFQMRQSEQPGCAIAVHHAGKIVLDAAFGSADLRTGEKLTPRHRFRVASHSKSFTAAAMLKLRERGLLKLDDAAGQFVSGLHPDVARATVAQLLSHSAGLTRDGVDAGYWQGRAEFLNAAKLRAALKRPLVIDAATRLKYSNHGFGLAGMIIEAVSGQSYADFVMREIVRPAGLKETVPDVPVPKGAKLASGHSGKTLLGKRVIFPGGQSTHALAAATGFISTAADLARFFAQLAPAAKTSVLRAESRREMTRPQWKDPHAPIETGYGLGIVTGTSSGWDWFGHSGGFQGYLTRTVMVPARDITISVLTNAADGTPAVWSDGVLHILARFAAGGAPTKRTRDWTGRWWSVWGATDLVPVGDRVLTAAPALAAPLLKVTEISVQGRDRARISQAGAFGNFGEEVRRIRKGGKVRAVQLASTRLLPEVDMAREMKARYR